MTPALPLSSALPSPPTFLPAAAALPRRTLWSLAVAVLAGHLVLLDTLPSALAPPDRLATRAFTTRTIVRQAPAPAEVPAPTAAMSPPAPRPRSAARPRRPAVTPAEPASTHQAMTATEASVSVAATDPPPSVGKSGTEPAVQAVAESVALAPEPAASEAGDQAVAPGADAVIGPAPPPQAPPSPPQIAATAPLTLAIPGSARLKYELTGEVNKQNWFGRGELLWLQDGQTYDARLEFSALFLGSRIRTSSGRITNRGLAPTRFGDKWRREVAAHFERDKGVVSFSANTPSWPLLADAQDQLSVLLQLGAMIAGDPAKYPANSTVSLPVVGMRDADTWAFTVGSEERLYLPVGETAALKLARNPRREFDQKIEAWLAPALGYLPVRVRVTEANGNFIEQNLRATDKP